MDPKLSILQPYPFQKLSALLAGVKPDASLRPISLSIGEPKHATPQFIRDVLVEQLGGLSSYPATAGSEPLRKAIAGNGIEYDPCALSLGDVHYGVDGIDHILILCHH